MIQPKKILHIFPSFTIGGAQNRLATLINIFDQKYEHHIISINGEEDALALINSSANYIFHSQFSHIKGIWAVRKAFRSFLEKNPANLMLTYNWGSMDYVTANIPALCPHIHVEDGFGIDENPQKPNGLKRRRNLWRKLFLTSTPIIVPSYTLYQIATRYWVWPSQKENVHYVPNGVDTQKFSIQPQSECPFPKNQDNIVIGCVAALRPEKNLSALLQAIKVLKQDYPDIQCVIIGDGQERQKLEKLSHDLEISSNIHFAGQQKNIEKFYPYFDIFTLSSFTEQAPLTILEAMACGVAIAAFDVGDIKNMVSAQNMPYIQGKTSDVLALSLKSLIHVPEQRKLCGYSNHIKANELFSLGHMCNQWQAIFE